MSIMSIDPIGILQRTLSNSQPIPPTPTIKILSFLNNYVELRIELTFVGTS